MIEKLKHSSDLVNLEPTSHLALFVPNQRESKSGFWLEPDSTIEEYVNEGILKSGVRTHQQYDDIVIGVNSPDVQDTVELRLKTRMLKVKVPVSGYVVILDVDEAKTVHQLMDDICLQLKITNNHNFSLARDKDPREVARSVRSKAKDKKERRLSVQAVESPGVAGLD